MKRANRIRGAILFALVLMGTAATVQAGKWFTYAECELVEDRYFDGDSFNVKAPTGYTYVFRLYGVDCPETDKRIPERVREQAGEFGITEQELRRWGEKSKRFVKKFLRKPFTVHTRKVKAGGAGRKNRYFAIIIGADGERLDEALVQAGLARAYGMGVEWPEGTKPDRYLRKLRTLENAAKREKVGIWGAGEKAGGRN